jgi:hypothetical protein
MTGKRHQGATREVYRRLHLAGLGRQPVTAMVNWAIMNLPKKCVSTPTRRATTSSFEEKTTACNLLLRTELYR